jgi:hypothetical protein
MRSDDVSSGSAFDTLETIAIVGALALITLPAIKRIGCLWRVRHPRAMKEPAIDKTLKDTYPASDPPASRYFDIPVNRR